MTFWNCQLWNTISDKIHNYSVKDFSVRFRLIKLILLIWIIATTLSLLIFYDYVYNLEILKEYTQDFTLHLFEFLPIKFKLQVVGSPYNVSIALIILALVQIFQNKFRVILSLATCVIFNFHLYIVNIVGTGTTTIIANFTTYIFLLELALFIEKKSRERYVFKHFIFFSMKLQMCIVYLVSGSVKLISPIWTNGAATYYIFHNRRYGKFPDFLPFIDNSDLIWQITSILPIIFLLLFPIMVWTRKTKIVVFMSILFHGFIAIGMGLKEFMIFPILDYLLFCDVTNLKMQLEIFVSKLKKIKTYSLGLMKINA